MVRETKDKIKTDRARRPEKARAATRREVGGAARRAIAINREALTELAKW